MLCEFEAQKEIDLATSNYILPQLEVVSFMMVPLRHVVYYVNPQERKPQAQRVWLDLLQGRAHNVHKVDVCACSVVSMKERRLWCQAALVAGEEGSRCDALLRA